MTDLVTALRDFNKDRKFNRKGPLCVALVVTQHARKGLPLNPDELLTEAGGQVLGGRDDLGNDARPVGGVQLCALVRQILVVGRYPGVTDHRLVFHGAPFVANIVANNKLFATDFCNMMTPGKRGMQGVSQNLGFMQRW